MSVWIFGLILTLFGLKYTSKIPNLFSESILSGHVRCSRLSQLVPFQLPMFQSYPRAQMAFQKVTMKKVSQRRLKIAFQWIWAFLWKEPRVLNHSLSQLAGVGEYSASQLEGIKYLALGHRCRKFPPGPSNHGYLWYEKEIKFLGSKHQASFPILLSNSH